MAKSKLVFTKAPDRKVYYFGELVGSIEPVTSAAGSWVYVPDHDAIDSVPMHREYLTGILKVWSSPYQTQRELKSFLRREVSLRP